MSTSDVIDIVDLNRDVEQYVIQASSTRSRHRFGKIFGDKFMPLTFVHAADMHASKSQWERMVKYVNHYSEYLSFVLHTGDYCGGNQGSYVDFYKAFPNCTRPIYNCVGNHDCVGADDIWSLAPGPKDTTHRMLFGHTKGWDVNFAPCEYPMSYYKDFADSNVRMIVLDLYYDIWETRVWLREVLRDAFDKGLHVLTAMHERTGSVETEYGVSFHTLDDHHAAEVTYELDRTEGCFDHRWRVTYADVIAEFIGYGGTHICNLAGHEHHNEFGLCAKGILNVVVAAGCINEYLGDMRHVDGTRSMDCFNVVGIDTELGLLKLIRVGANVDHYMRRCTALCFDYINRKVISDI